MPYNLTITNGSSLVTVADNSYDHTTTSLNLIGSSYPGYGLLLNENFVSLLENFSNNSAPLNPLQGQLWWDSQNKELKVWNIPSSGAPNWKVISNSQTGATAPTTPVNGDFWWNGTVLSVYNGSGWTSIGPANPANVAITAILQNTITDNTTTPHIVGNILVNNKLIAIASSDTLPFIPQTPITGYTSINPGLNLSTNITVTANASVGGILTVSGNSILANISGTNLTSTNLTSTINANLANLTVSGAAQLNGTTTFNGNVIIDGLLTLPSNSTAFANIAGNVAPSANLTYNLGSPTAYWNNVYGTSIHAQYADLAERFEADAEYEPGTVVEMGGTAEITAVGNDLSEEVFGVISTNAAYLMNSSAGTDSTHPPIAVQGRVPVKVTGVIRKGDRLVSAGNGIARAGKRSEITTWNVIGRALEDKTTTGLGMIEAVVKLNS